MTSETETLVKRLAALEIEDSFKSQDIQRQRKLYETVCGKVREINLIKDYDGYMTETVAPIEVRQK